MPFPVFDPLLQFFKGFFSTTMVFGTAAAITTFTASLEIVGSNVRIPLTRNGNPVMTMAADEIMMRTDPLFGVVIQPGAQVIVRTWRQAVGGSYNVGMAGTTLAAIDEGAAYLAVSNAAGQDRTMTGGPAAANGGGGQPYWLLGYADPAAADYCLITTGDSIGMGLSENSQFTGDGDGNIGMIDRWAALRGLNVINLNRASSRGYDWRDNDVSAINTWLDGITCNVYGSNHGRNDFNNNVDADTLAKTHAAVKRRIAPNAKRFIVFDVPNASGLKSGQTVYLADNQTRAAGSSTLYETRRVAFNQLAAQLGVEGQTGVFKMATYTDTVNVDGTVVWVDNGTIDGTHPVQLTNNAAAVGNRDIQF